MQMNKKPRYTKKEKEIGKKIRENVLVESIKKSVNHKTVFQYQILYSDMETKIVVARNFGEAEEMSLLLKKGEIESIVKITEYQTKIEDNTKKVSLWKKLSLKGAFNYIAV